MAFKTMYKLIMQLKARYPFSGGRDRLFKKGVVSVEKPRWICQSNLTSLSFTKSKVNLNLPLNLLLRGRLTLYP